MPDAPPQKSPEEIQREIKAARDLVAEICAAKNIELRFKREAQGGHYDLPEVWTIERAVPLDYEDLYKITASEYLTVQTRAHDDGLIYAEWFAVNIDRVVYEQD